MSVNNRATLNDMTRMKPKDRQAIILDAAVRMSRNYGYQNVTRADVAGAAECSEALVSNYFGTMVQLRRAVVRAAIKQRDHAIILQAIAANDPHAKKIPTELKVESLASVIK